MYFAPTGLYIWHNIYRAHINHRSACLTTDKTFLNGIPRLLYALDDDSLQHLIGHLDDTEEASILQHEDDVVHNFPDALVFGVNIQVGLLRYLIWVVNSSEARDRTSPGSRVDTSPIGLFRIL